MKRTIFSDMDNPKYRYRAVMEARAADLEPLDGERADSQGSEGQRAKRKRTQGKRGRAHRRQGERKKLTLLLRFFSRKGMAGRRGSAMLATACPTASAAATKARPVDLRTRAGIRKDA
jgi:hypothetical protein